MANFCEIVMAGEILNAHRKYEKRSQNPFPEQIEKYDLYMNDLQPRESERDSKKRISDTIQKFVKEMRDGTHARKVS